MCESGEGQLIYKLVGAAVTIASLFAASAGPVGIEAISYRDAEIFSAAGGDVSAAVETKSGAGSQNAAQAVDDRAGYTIAALIASDSQMANYLSRLSPHSNEPTTGGSFESNGQEVTDGPAVAATQASDDRSDGSSDASSTEDDSKLSVPMPRPRPPARDLIPANSSRTRAAAIPAKLTPHPAGCAQCIEQVAQATPDPAHSFPAILIQNPWRKARPVRAQGAPAGNGRDREAPLVTARTFTRG